MYLYLWRVAVVVISCVFSSSSRNLSHFLLFLRNPIKVSQKLWNCSNNQWCLLFVRTLFSVLSILLQKTMEAIMGIHCTLLGIVCKTIWKHLFLIVIVTSFSLSFLRVFMQKQIGEGKNFNQVPELNIWPWDCIFLSIISLLTLVPKINMRKDTCVRCSCWQQFRFILWKRQQELGLGLIGFKVVERHVEIKSLFTYWQIRLLYCQNLQLNLAKDNKANNWNWHAAGVYHGLTK